MFITLFNCQTQQDGTLGTFRPADDIFEEASRKLQPSLQSNEAENSVLSNDILRFASMKVVKESLKRICDIKGNVSLLFLGECRLSSLPQR
jgi:ribonuclease H2 subunit B